jgi:DNA-binding transcriptional LysR family regulator
LVLRHPTGYRLTELGKSLVVYAERVEKAVNSFERRLSITTEVSGTVRVTCPEALGSRLMRSRLIEKFNTQYPALRVELVMSDHLIDLARGEVDIAFRATPPTEGALYGRRIARSPWGVYASRSYVKRHGSIVSIEAIQRHAVIGFDGNLRHHPASKWLQSVAPKARIVARGTSLPAVLMAVKSGAGLGALPVIIGDEDGDLVRVFGPMRDLPTDFYLLMHEDMKETPRVRAFFDFILDELAAVRAVLTPKSALLNGTNDATHSKHTRRKR